MLVIKTSTHRLNRPMNSDLRRTPQVVWDTHRSNRPLKVARVMEEDVAVVVDAESAEILSVVALRSLTKVPTADLRVQPNRYTLIGVVDKENPAIGTTLEGMNRSLNSLSYLEEAIPLTEEARLALRYCLTSDHSVSYV